MIIKQNRFLDWQKQLIHTNNFGDITNNELISLFVNDGLLPFILKNGYTLCRNSVDFTNCIATILFELYSDRYYNVKLSSYMFDDEFYNYFNYNTDWDIFWKTWNNYLDNYLSYNTNTLCVQIQDFIFSSLDFEKSPKYIEYIEENYDFDAPENNKKDIDPYMLENYHYKFTKFDV